jgi:hypothetical protein
MGHLIFVVMHLLCLLFGSLGLLLTIPLHLIYAAISNRSSKPSSSSDADDWKTYGRCPYCKEQVRRDAVKCKHCGSVLDPAAMQAEVAAREAEKREDAKNAAIGIAIAVGLLALAIFFGRK